MYTELRREVDYGTPRSQSVESITLEIDGESVTVPKGTSLDARGRRGRHQCPEAMRDGQPECIRLVPPVPD